MSDDPRIAKGLANFKKAYHGAIPAPDVNRPFGGNTIKNLFGEIYDRTAISDRDRRLLIFGAIAGVGGTAQFETHARAALANGEVKPEELEEFLLVLVNYCGYPRTAGLVGVAGKVIAELKAK